MALHIDKNRTNSIDDIDNDIFGNWNNSLDEELMKLMAKKIQDSINIENTVQILDSTLCVDIKITNNMIDLCNNSMYRPELTVKFNENR